MEQDIGCCVHSAAPIPPRSQLSRWACTSRAQAGSGVGKARAGAHSLLWQEMKVTGWHQEGMPSMCCVHCVATASLSTSQ